MEITKRAAQWSAPQAVSKPGICEIKANHAMTHSHSNRGYRKTAPAVSVCMTTTGQSVLLCSHCASYVEVLQWLAQIGHRDDMVPGQLAALAYVWRAEQGFVMPAIQSFGGSYQTLGTIAHHLNKLVKLGLLKRIGTSYLMRDACPSCFRRVCNSDCHLHMSATDFVPRRETQITTGA